MSDAERLKYLRLALRIIGVFAIFGFYPLTRVWPSGWAWHSGQSYLQMMIAIYATLGVFLIIAARDPRQHVGQVVKSRLVRQRKSKTRPPVLVRFHEVGEVLLQRCRQCIASRGRGRRRRG